MTILDTIVKTKRQEVAAAKEARPVAELRSAIETAAPPRDFLAAVTGPPTRTVNLIAEVKKASPSAGVIMADFDPVAIAKTYAENGASALSVLTDETYFSGRLDYIDPIKQAVDLPVLRKEFIIDDYQVVESRAARADAILLISEILTLDEVHQFHATARELGMAVLVEGHSAENLLAVIERLGPPTDNGYLLGINNRNLHVQKTDVNTTVEIASVLPPGTPFVSESGLHTREDVEVVARAGACAILVGESLLRSDDIGEKVRALLGPARN
jgi:indole-3-glycerol phosphate synthase